MVRTLAPGLVAGSVTLWAAAGTAAPPAAGQVMTGTVYGTVTDAQGGVIPGATVILISETRGTKSAPVITRDTGDYVFPNVTADTYTVEVTMSGFKTAKREALAVSPGDRVAVPSIALDVGGGSEMVTVVAERPIIQAQSGERSFTIIPEEVDSLPIVDRTFSTLAAMAPGMSDIGGDNPQRLGGGGANNAMFDGVGVLDTGSNAIGLKMTREVVSQIKVITSSYQAEYGRSSG